MHNFWIDVTIPHFGVSSMLESSFKSNSKHNRLFFPGNFDQMQNVYLYGNMSRFRCHFEIDLIIGHQSQGAFGTFLENQVIFGSFQALQHWQQLDAACTGALKKSQKQPNFPKMCQMHPSSDVQLRKLIFDYKFRNQK